MKILMVDDHTFYSEMIVDWIREQGHEIHYVTRYDDAVKVLEKEGKFDFSILDVILQNGKTGLTIVKNYPTQLGKILFLTGCTDQPTLNSISPYASIHKTEVIWDHLEKFFINLSYTPHIDF